MIRFSTHYWRKKHGCFRVVSSYPLRHPRSFCPVFRCEFRMLNWILIKCETTSVLSHVTTWQPGQHFPINFFGFRESKWCSHNLWVFCLLCCHSCHNRKKAAKYRAFLCVTTLVTTLWQLLCCCHFLPPTALLTIWSHPHTAYFFPIGEATENLTDFNWLLLFWFLWNVAVDAAIE